MGYLMRRHDAGRDALVYHVARAIGGMLCAILRGRLDVARSTGASCADAYAHDATAASPRCLRVIGASAKSRRRPSRTRHDEPRAGRRFQRVRSHAGRAGGRRGSVAQFRETTRSQSRISSWQPDGDAARCDMAGDQYRRVERDDGGLLHSGRADRRGFSPPTSSSAPRGIRISRPDLRVPHRSRDARAVRVASFAGEVHVPVHHPHAPRSGDHTTHSRLWASGPLRPARVGGAPTCSTSRRRCLRRSASRCPTGSTGVRSSSRNPRRTQPGGASSQMLRTDAMRRRAFAVAARRRALAACASLPPRNPPRVDVVGVALERVEGPMHSSACRCS